MQRWHQKILSGDTVPQFGVVIEARIQYNRCDNPEERVQLPATSPLLFAPPQITKDGTAEIVFSYVAMIIFMVYRLCKSSIVCITLHAYMYVGTRALLPCAATARTSYS